MHDDPHSYTSTNFDSFTRYLVENIDETADVKGDSHSFAYPVTSQFCCFGTY